MSSDLEDFSSSVVVVFFLPSVFPSTSMATGLPLSTGVGFLGFLTAKCSNNCDLGERKLLNTQVDLGREARKVQAYL